jgi:hypothetical protein
MSRTTVGRAAVALAAAATLTVALVQGRATSASADRTGTSPPAAPQGAAALSVSGPPIAPTRVTLLTGDTTTLNPGGTSGHYSVTASSVPRANGIAPPIQVTGASKASDGVFAIPDDVAELVRQGAVDRGLFDLTYRATHGLAGGSIQVALRYPDRDSSAAVAAAAQALPASSYVSTVAGTHDAIVKVDLAQAATFWAAVTAPAKVDPSTPAGRVQVGQPFPTMQLAGNVRGIWLPEHRVGVQAHPSLSTYDVTETIKAPTDPADWCTPQQPLCLNAPLFSMLPLTGASAGLPYGPSSIACVDPQCASYVVHYQVPAGTYHVDGQAETFRGDRWNNFELTDPQVTVAGPTSFGLDTNQAKKFVVDTPAPTESYASVFMNFRALPDGQAYISMTFNAYGYQAWWAIPTAPVSVGSFHLGQGLLLGQPPVTMAVTAPRNIALSAIYPMATIYPADPNGVIRFSGNRSLQLVSVNEGAPSDYDGQDTAGKLVLIRVRHFAGCKVYMDQLATAKQHGALGALIDPSDPAQSGGNCLIPMYPSWGANPPVMVDLPYAELPPADVHTLLGLLGHGRVTIEVNGNGNTPYVYQTNTYQEGRVPDSLHYSFGRDDFASTPSSYHSDQPGRFDQDWGSWRADEWLSGGVELEKRAQPTSIRVYAGPVTPDLVTLQTLWQTTPAGTVLQQSMAVAGGTTTAHWGSGPLTPGPMLVDRSVLDGQPGKWGGLNPEGFCTDCRQGDLLYPIAYLMDGANPRAYNGPWTFSDAHLYSGDTEIVANPVNGLPAFTLPAATARYRMTTDDAGTHTEWHFVSSRPTTDRVPAGISCVGLFLGVTSPCHADPLVFLRYDAGLRPDNTLTAPGWHPITVTAYHQDPNAPRITGLTLSVSYDDGKTWHRAALQPVGGDSYRTILAVPPVARTGGHVSLRATATDAGGNDVTQTIDQAITLAGR